MRLLEIRTRKEIEQEKYALKIMRGDFENLDNVSQQDIDVLKRAITKS